MHGPIKPNRSEKQRYAGNAPECMNCGKSLHPKRASRRQRYCCYRCRDEARRKRKFAARYPYPANPRSVQNNNAISIACIGHFADRPSRICAPRVAIERELFAGRRWHDVVSPDGVKVQVADFRPPLGARASDAASPVRFEAAP